MIERLLKEYPETVVGIKDSGGDWKNSEEILKRFPGFAVFSGTEAVLLKNLESGGAGCISATANINAAAIHDLYANWQAPDAEAKQEELNTLRTAMQRFPMIPALKQVVAHYSGDANWDRVRPPLVRLDAEQKTALLNDLDKRSFTMPGLAA